MAAHCSKTEDKIKVAYFDGAVSYGGSVVVLSDLLSGLPAGAVESLVITALKDNTDIERLFSGRASRVVRHTPRLDYVSKARWEDVVSNKPLWLRRLWAYIYFIGALLLNAPSFLKLGLVLIRFRPDILHINNGAILFHWARILKIPVVFHIHGAGRWRGEAAGRVMAGTRQFVAISEYVRGLAAEAGIADHQINVVSNPVSITDVSSEQCRELRASMGIAPDDVVLVHAGRLVRWKGQLEFLQAIAEARPQMPNFKALVVGGDEEGFTTEYVKELHDFVREHALTDQVIFVGHSNQVRQLMAMADIVVHSSIEPEPFGLVITESMSVGVPVIAADLGAPKEILRDGVDGLIVSPTDRKQFAGAILRMSQNPSLRSGMGRNGKERVLESFSVQHYGREIMKIYKKALAT